VRLEGARSFLAGDDPRFAEPGFDDSAWGKAEVPGPSLFPGLGPTSGIGWYRFIFRPPPPPRPGDLALSIGRITSADEAFLNGVRIGGTGRISAWPVEADGQDRVYSIPPGLMRHGEDNVLAVRVFTTLADGGIVAGPVCLGAKASLELGKVRRETSAKFAEVVLLTFLGVFCLVWLLLYTAGVREPEYAWFGVMLLLYTSTFLLDSLLLADAGLRTPFVQRLVYAGCALLPVCTLPFLARAFSERLPRWARGLAALLLLTAFLLLLPVPFRLLRLLLLAGTVSIVAALAAGIFLALQARLKRRHESGPILAGLVGLLAGVLAGTFGAGDPRWFRSFLPDDLGAVFLIMCTTYALMARYARLQSRLRWLSKRILVAEEEERKRLSRDIHDGIGQTMLAIKLRLQMLAAASSDREGAHESPLEGVITEVANASVELRHLAQDLRPALLEELPLEEALSHHARDLSRRAELQVTVVGTAPPDLPASLKDNLYRIVQEALHNTAKHAGAEAATVSLIAREGWLTLQVADDGRGFDPMSRDAGGGLGLSTMRERAELLGGLLRVRSTPGKGTSVQVEVPL